MQKPINYAVSFVQLYHAKPVHLVQIYLVAIIETLFIAKSNKTETKYAQGKWQRHTHRRIELSFPMEFILVLCLHLELVKFYQVYVIISNVCISMVEIFEPFCLCFG